jgi:hypothetical protein
MTPKKKNILIAGLSGNWKDVAEELKPLHPAGFFTSEIR